MEIKRIPVGMIGTNCYIVYSGNECAVIDPGDEAERIALEIEKSGVEPKAILLTHGHFDHIGAVNELRSRYRCKVIIGAKDNEMLTDMSKNLTPFKSAGKYIIDGAETVIDGDEINIGGINFTVFETPGHSRGSVCYLAEQNLFSGDTLFRQECGRTDLYGGNYSEIKKSLKRLSELDEAVKVYPGHGEESNIAHERRYNPYMGCADYDDIY